MRRRGWAVGAAGVVVVGLLALGWWSRQAPGRPGAGLWAALPSASAASAPVPLEFTAAEVVHPEPMRLARHIEFGGPLVAPDTAVVKAKAAGVLLDLAVQEGSVVRAGQVLARIDQAEAASRVAEREAALASAQAALTQAEKTQASNERLAAQGFISTIALDNGRAALDNARAQVDQARAALQTARVGLREATVVAPIAGVVAKRHVLPGEKVAPEQPLATLVNLARLELAGAVGTHEVSALQPGLPVRVQVEGLDTPLEGTLARIAPAAEPGSRSIAVAVALPNPQGRLRAGPYAVARVTLPDAEARLTLPLAAVQGSDGAPQVWLIEAGQLQRRSVTLGRSDDGAGRVQVVSGLTSGSVVLGQRYDNLRDGAPARVVAMAASAAQVR